MKYCIRYDNTFKYYKDEDVESIISRLLQAADYNVLLIGMIILV